jgi:GTP-binding protein YchF
VEVALVGLQNSGKSAVFDLLTGPGSLVPQTGAERRATLKLADPRLEALTGTLNPKKTTQAALSLVDPPPAGRAEGRGGADPFAPSRTADGLIVVLRAFDAPEVPHPADTVDFVRDMGTVRSEIILTDLVVLDGRLEKIEKLSKVGRKPENPQEVNLLERCRASLEAEKPLGELELSPPELKLLSGFGLMSTKPQMALLNVGETGAAVEGESGGAEALLAHFRASFPDTSVLPVCAPLELELAEMEPEDAREFMDAEGLERLARPAILEALTAVCGRITFFTVIKDEVRAWTVPDGATAAQAAGAVHTDMEKGFIRAEVIGWKGLVKYGSYAAARDGGDLRLEGREYRVQDGDVLTVRFSPK